MKIFKVFFGWVSEVKVAICLRKFKIRDFFTGFVPTGWSPCCETWLKFGIEALRCRKRKKKIKVKKCSGRGLPR